MPYTKGGPYSTGGTATAANLNNLETQYDAATLSLERDLLTPFVRNGLTAAKNGTTASQLDLAQGVAFPLQTDNTLMRRSISAQSFTTVTINTTYFLDLNPDGTLSWGTAHSGTANYLPICSVTTDGAGNIVTVTDARTLNTTLLSGMAGVLQLLTLYSDSGAITSDGSGNLTANNFVGGLKDNVSAASAIAAHDTGSTMQFKPTAANRGILISSRDSGGTLHNGITIDTSGNTQVAGTFSSDGGTITTDGSGNLSAVTLKDGSKRVAVQGSHSAGQPIISYGTGAPVSLAANEIYIQLS